MGNVSDSERPSNGQTGDAQDDGNRFSESAMPLGLKAGDAHHRAYVGPPEQFQFMGATQFMLLISMGLSPSHRLLDVGCGSLRGGRFSMNYLESGNYYGLEPNRWLIEDAFKYEIGEALRAIKRPHFMYNDRFDATGFETRFDFILAQSVFSHTGSDLMRAGLSALRSCLAKDGIMLATFKVDDFDEEYVGWKYPGGVRYTKSTLHRIMRDSGFQFMSLPWFHPRQTWFALALNANQLPDAHLADRYLCGAVLRSPEFAASIKDATPLPRWIRRLVRRFT